MKISFKAVGNTLQNILVSAKAFRDICKQSMTDTNITLNKNFQLLIDVIDVAEKPQQTDITHTDKFICGVKHTLLKYLSEFFFDHTRTIA